MFSICITNHNIFPAKIRWLTHFDHKILKGKFLLDPSSASLSTNTRKSWKQCLFFVIGEKWSAPMLFTITALLLTCIKLKSLCFLSLYLASFQWNVVMCESTTNAVKSRGLIYKKLLRSYIILNSIQDRISKCSQMWFIKIECKHKKCTYSIQHL